MTDWTVDDLLPEGERVNPQAIEDGLMVEQVVIHEGRVRYLPRFTPLGVARIAKSLGLDPNTITTKESA